MQAVIVGLTGGIASGKSAAAAMFRALGVPVVDADEIAREVVARGTPGLEAIVEAFGAGVLAADGSLDRKALGKRVFADAEARARLNAITHPRIAMASTEKLSTLGDVPCGYAIYEAPLLVENGIHHAMAAVVLIAASPEVQLERLTKRDGLAEPEARARIEAQLPLEEKLKVATHVIWNDDGLAELERKVLEAHRDLVARYGPKEGGPPGDAPTEGTAEG